MRNVTVFKISKEVECVAADIIEFAKIRPIDFAPCINSEDFLVYKSYEKLTSPVERICTSINGHVQEEFACIHPRDKEKISLLIDMTEASKRDVIISKERGRIKALMDAGFFTRLKWLFTGVDLILDVKYYGKEEEDE